MASAARQRLANELGWTEQWRPTMDTVLFTDHSIVLFAITTCAIALMLSVLGLATPHSTRADIEQELKGLRWER
jgi:hypothetical protein